MSVIAMVTVEEVERRLLAACPGAEVDISNNESDHRITGTVRWDGFKKLSVPERWDHVAKTVRDPLGALGLNIGMLYLLAPGERLDG